MATKTLTITEDAYERLNVLKEENESFSEVIRRVTTRVHLSDFAGLLTHAEAKNVREKIATLRNASTNRAKAIRARFT